MCVSVVSDGLKDLSQEAEMMKGQAHAHQAYLANASALRLDRDSVSVYCTI